MKITQRIRRTWDNTRSTVADVIERASRPPSWTMFQTYGEPSAEKVKTSFDQYAERAYGGNSAVFGILNAQIRLFAEVRFAFRNRKTKKLDPTHDGLSVLGAPWPNGTTGDLLTRMRQDAQLAGNAYVRRVGPERLERLRPDWVTIVSWVRDGTEQETPDGRQLREVVGFLFEPNGDPDRDVEFYDVDEVAHWAPIPDPLANWRGMSVLTPALKEINADLAMTDHRDAFFRRAATPNLIIKYAGKLQSGQKTRLRDAIAARHAGPSQAGGTLVLDEGADPMIVGSKFTDAQFDELVAAGENRIAVAAGVPAVVAGLKLGLQDAAWSMYRQAMRAFTDIGMRPDWRGACAALAKLVDVPDGWELWYDTSDVAALQEGEQETAATMQTNAATLSSLITNGYEPDSARDALVAGDLGLLKHTGRVSVQLHDPNADPTPPPTPPPATATAAGDVADQADPADPADPAAGEEQAVRAEFWRVFAELLRAWNPAVHPRDHRGRFRNVADVDLVDGTVDVRALNDRRLGYLLSHLASPTPNDTNTAAIQAIYGELDRRDVNDHYAEVVASVPDAEGLTRLDEDEVISLYSQVTAVERDPDPAAFARLNAELDRRSADAVAAEGTREARDFLARPVTEMSEDDLDQAAQYASTLDDAPAMERVYGEWFRREQAEAARIEADRQAAAAAEAARIEAEQAAARAEADRVAAEQAAEQARQEQLAAEIRATPTLALVEMQRRGVFGITGEADQAAARERAELAGAEVQRRKDAAAAAEARNRWVRAMPVDLTDDELADAITNHEADGYNTNDTRARRLESLRSERARREEYNARRALISADVPTEPAWLPNPVAKLGELERSIEARYDSTHAYKAAARLALAKRRTYGLADDADDKATTAAGKADPRSLPERAAMTLAWYRHLSKLDESLPRDRDGNLIARQQYLAGWPDQQPGPAPRATQPPANVAKAATVWQEIQSQAVADRAAGDESTARRFITAGGRAYGLPDDAEVSEVSAAKRADTRTEAQKAAAYIAEYRALAAEQGVDPSDRLRYGPPDRGTPKARTRPGGQSTPEQEARIDELVTSGRDYIEAYAEVHGLDPDAMRRQEAGAAASGSWRGGTDKALRKSYDEWVHLQYLDAEQWTRGNLLSKDGKARDIRARNEGRGTRIDPAWLMSAPLRMVRRYASEDLLRYWAEHPRMTFVEFKANTAGGTTARQAREAALSASAGRDFV